MTDDARLADYRDRLAEAGLDDYAERLCQLAGPSVRLIPDPAAAVLPGGSRLGGRPALPESRPWPTQDGLPLSLIAQLDLAELARHDSDKALPSDGLLLFFYDAASQQGWGFDPDDRGSSAVVHVPADEVAGERPPPAPIPVEGVFPPIALTPSVELTFVPWESATVKSFGMSQDDWYAYAEALPESNGTRHRLLGHPDPIQGDMQLECQLASNGLYCGDPSGYKDPRAARLRPGAVEWRLLLQVDTEDQVNMMWGDVGRIYYWIRDEDLAARRWDRSWLVLQCG